MKPPLLARFRDAFSVRPLMVAACLVFVSGQSDLSGSVIVMKPEATEEYPDSEGAEINIGLDCYQLPMDTVEPFFDRFVDGIRTHPDWASDCERIHFRITNLEEPETTKPNKTAGPKDYISGV